MICHPKQAVSCSCFISDVQNYCGATGIFALCFGSGMSLLKKREINQFPCLN